MLEQHHVLLWAVKGTILCVRWIKKLHAQKYKGTLDHDSLSQSQVNFRDQCVQPPGGHFLRLWQWSSCFSLHEGADDGSAARLMPFCVPAQLFPCNGPSPGISPTQMRPCWETQQNVCDDTYGRVILWELDYLCNLNVLPAVTRTLTKSKIREKLDRLELGEGNGP